MKKITWAPGLLLVGLLLGAQEEKRQVIKIMSSLPRTGSAKAQTDTIANAIRMAIDEAGGKIGGFAIEYIDGDDATAVSGGQWTAEGETKNANRAVNDPDIMVYIGTYNSGAAKCSMPILNRAGLVMISPANTWPGLTKPGKGDPGEPDVYRPTKKINYCRVVPADDLQGPLGADWAKALGFKKVFVLDDSEAYGKTTATCFKERAREIGIEVLGQESIDWKANSFAALMGTIKEKGADLVYFGGTTQSKGGQIAKDLFAVHPAAKLMVPDGCFEDAFIEAAGAESVNDRCFVTFGGVLIEQLTGAGKQFVERYQKKFGGRPEAYAIYGYEAAKVALEAIRKAGKKDRDAIREAVLATKDFDGLLGPWSFDANGDTTSTLMSGCIVKDGKFEFAKLLGTPPKRAIRK